MRDFALLDDLSLSLSPGLNVITGETGAGKSLLIDAVSVVTGARAMTDYIRTGSSTAHISALLRADGDEPAALWLRAAGIPSDEGTVVLQREIHRNGPSVARINGQLVTAGQLSDLCRLLLDMHGQHEHQSLVRPRQQRRLLDRYGGPRVEPLLADVARIRHHLLDLRAELGRLGGTERERAQRLEWLSYQIEEIEAARLSPGEDEGLAARRMVLANLDRLRQLLGDSYDLLREGADGEPSVLDRLGVLREWMGAASRVDASLAATGEAVDDACFRLEDVALDVRRYLEELSFDPGELDAVEERLDVITRLKRKYGDSIDEILSHQQAITAEKSGLEVAEERAQALSAEIDDAAARLGTAAQVLSSARQGVARELELAVNEELARLNMKEARFKVAFEVTDDPGGVPVDGRLVRCGDEGIDRLEFFIAPNPGEPPRPLARTASGGELSRIMLAIKTVLAGVDDVPTMIFDEIDAGIGGVTARRVAERLGLLSRSRQVLCVTHLAPIAAMADAQFAIEKLEEEGRTRTMLRALCVDQRVIEVARMMAAGPGGAGREHASELLAEARKWREAEGGKTHRG